MNHTRKAFEKLYDANGQLDESNVNVLRTIISYSVEAQFVFDKSMHESYSDIEKIEGQHQKDILKLIITCNNQHLKCGAQIMDVLNDPSELRIRYDSGTLETEIELYFTNVDYITELTNTVSTTRFRKWILQLCDGGNGVGCYFRLTRLFDLMWAIVIQAELIEKVHNAGGHSALNPAEQTVSSVKFQTRTLHPISATHAVAFHDINNKDIVNVDIKKYRESEINDLKKNAREICEFYSALLNHQQKSMGGYLKSRTIDYTKHVYLFSHPIQKLISDALDKNHSMHSLIEFFQKIEENHTIRWRRGRFSIDMNADHWIKSDDDVDCPLKHNSNATNEFIGFGVCKAPVPGQWTKTNTRTYKDHDVFEYKDIQEPMEQKDIADRMQFVPTHILDVYLEENFKYLFEDVRPCFKGIRADCPIASTTVILPDQVETDIESMRAQGLKPNVVRQDLNKKLNSSASFHKYLALILKDGKAILMKNSQIIWNHKDAIIQTNVIPDEVKSVMCKIKRVTVNITDDTILRMMKARIGYIESKDNLKNKYDANNNQIERQVNINMGVDSQNRSMDSSNDTSSSSSGSSSSSESSSESDSSNDSDSSSDANSDGKICVKCNAMEPPPHLKNVAVSVWLKCDKNDCDIHFECSGCWLPPHEHNGVRRIKWCGVC
eukprot:989483_1